MIACFDGDAALAVGHVHELTCVEVARHDGGCAVAVIEPHAYDQLVTRDAPDLLAGLVDDVAVAVGHDDKGGYGGALGDAGLTLGV
jgi:hypothetical protein